MAMEMTGIASVQRGCLPPCKLPFPSPPSYFRQTSIIPTFIDRPLFSIFPLIWRTYKLLDFLHGKFHHVVAESFVEQCLELTTDLLSSWTTTSTTNWNVWYNYYYYQLQKPLQKSDACEWIHLSDTEKKTIIKERITLTIHRAKTEVPDAIWKCVWWGKKSYNTKKTDENEKQALNFKKKTHIIPILLLYDRRSSIWVLT